MLSSRKRSQLACFGDFHSFSTLPFITSFHAEKHCMFWLEIMKFQLSHLRKRLGLLFFFVLSFVFLTAYFFFQEEHGWVCIVFFLLGGERRVISTLIRAFFSSFWEHQSFFVNQETYVCSSHHQYAIFFCFWPRTRDVVWITTFFSYKKLVNWVSFYSSGKIEDYFFFHSMLFLSSDQLSFRSNLSF